MYWAMCNNLYYDLLVRAITIMEQIQVLELTLSGLKGLRL